MKNDIAWSQIYRPRKIDDCIIPERLKSLFNGVIENDYIPNMVFSGSPGLGKTTVAVVLAETLEHDLLKIPASTRGNIDTLRTEITDFASTMSFNGKRKCIVLDEADKLTDATQDGLRSFIEDYSKNVSFIFTCNYPNKISDPIYSRAGLIDFNPLANERKQLATEFLTRLSDIMKDLNIEVEKKLLGNLIVKYFGDWRRLLNVMQLYYIERGVIDNGILANSVDKEALETLTKALKARKWHDVRQWAATHANRDTTALMRTIYEHLYPQMVDDSAAYLVVKINEYVYKNYFVADKELNLSAMLTEIMVDGVFKK